MRNWLLFSSAVVALLGCSDSSSPPSKPSTAEQSTPSSPTSSTTGQAVDSAQTSSPQLQERSDNELQMVLIRCPPGKFLMGDGDTEFPGAAWEKPQVETTLTNEFWIGKYEVTQAEWKKLMETEPWSEYGAGTDLQPAVAISWSDANAFCEKLTETERSAGRLADGLEYRLPTEAEWEYACRAGTQTRFNYGDDPLEFDAHGWELSSYKFDIQDTAAFVNGLQISEVGKKSPNAWGFYDFHGGVSEWCIDAYPTRESIFASGRDPRGVGGAYRVRRGGSWRTVASECRSAARNIEGAQMPMNNDAGFRVALARQR